MARRRGKAPPISLFSFQDIITSVTGIMVLITLMLGVDLIQRTVNSPPQKTVETTADLQTAQARVDDEIEELKQQLRERQRGIIDIAGVNPVHLREQLKDLAELNDQLRRELSESEQKKAEADRRKREAESEKSRRSSDNQTVASLLEEIRQVEEELRKIKQSNRVIFNPVAGNAKIPWLVETSDRGFTVAEMGKNMSPKAFPDVRSFRSWASTKNAANEYFVLLVKPTGVDAFHAASEILQQLHFDVGYDLLSATQTAIDLETGAGVK